MHSQDHAGSDCNPFCVGVDQPIKSVLNVLEKDDEEKNVNEEDRGKKDPDALDESADKSGPSGRGARRRTVATTGSTSKEPKKEAKTPKLIRRKSIQIIPPPNANPIVSFRLYYFDNNKMYLVPLGVR